MNKPIDTNTDPAVLNETENVGTAEGVDDVQQATDAFRTAMVDAANTSATHGIEQVVMETARQLHNGTISYAEAPGAVIDAMVGEHFANLDGTSQSAMRAALREALLQDTFFVVELESALGQALTRVQ